MATNRTHQATNVASELKALQTDLSTALARIEQLEEAAKDQASSPSQGMSMLQDEKNTVIFASLLASMVYYRSLYKGTITNKQALYSSLIMNVIQDHRALIDILEDPKWRDMFDDANKPLGAKIVAGKAEKN